DLPGALACFDRCVLHPSKTLSPRAAARFALLPEPFRMNLGVRQRLLASNRSVLQRQHALLPIF
ncbi:hypothetical protein NKJ68_31180, partial [Mesorhizobium sp. M0053]